MGGIRWELFGCLVLAWLAVFFCLIKGIKSSGKVSYLLFFANTQQARQESVLLWALLSSVFFDILFALDC